MRGHENPFKWWSRKKPAGQRKHDQRTERQWGLRSQGRSSEDQDMAQSIKCCRIVKCIKSWKQALDVAVNWEVTGDLRQSYFILDLVLILMRWVNLALEMENSVYRPEVISQCQVADSVYTHFTSFFFSTCHSFSSAAWTVQEFKLTLEQIMSRECRKSWR